MKGRRGNSPAALLLCPVLISQVGIVTAAQAIHSSDVVDVAPPLALRPVG
jgi:hypothetical protein